MGNKKFTAVTGFLAGAFILFLAFRVVSFMNVDVVEDNDSVQIIETIQDFRTGDLSHIINLDPDKSLMFGFTGAVVSMTGLSLENTARMVSLLSAIGIFFISYQIGKMFYSREASVTGLLIMAFIPALIALSVSVLTEPLYAFIVYAGLYLFLLNYKTLKLIPAFIIGITFGLSFLARLEGVLFIVLLPVLMAVYLLLKGTFRAELKPYLSWTGIFLAGFLLIGAIQVSWASYNMGTFALDGRQVWSFLLNEPGEASHDERIYGLRYSDEMTNARYLKKNPGRMVAESQSGITETIVQYTRRVRVNINHLYSGRLNELVGTVTLIFFAFGIARLYKSGRVYEVALVTLFILTCLTAPLLHTAAVRHMLVIAPIITVIAGIGLYSAIRYILSDVRLNKFYSYSAAGLIILLVLSVWATSLTATLKAPAINREYDPKVIERLAGVINNNYSDPKEVVFTAHKGYMRLYTDAKIIYSPYGNYNQLVNFLQANNIRYLLLNYEMQDHYPFVETFRENNYGDYFIRMDDEIDSYGRKLGLYKFNDENVSQL
jgi:hypothetical protein